MTSTIIDRTGSSSSSPSVERETGLLSSASLKGPCRTLSLTAITLSGERTVASVALVTGDRVLVGAQADETLNGIYLVSTGAWSRAPDWNRSDDVVNGTLTRVTEGDNAGLWECVSATTYVAVGDDPVAFASLISGLDGEAIHSATLVTSIDDTDEFGFWDSTLVDLVRITFANMKATLKTYFDAIYVGGALGGSDNRLLRADGAGGKTAQGSAITVDDSGNMWGVGTLSLVGNMSISKTWPTLILAKPASGSSSVIVGTNNGVNRFSIEIGGAGAESGSDTGSDFTVSAFNDVGTWIDSPLTIQRAASGFVYLNRALNLGKGQIDFPASQNASTGANTFDDFEEGSFTPGMTFNGSAIGVTYSVQSGAYTKLAKLVNFTFSLTLTNNGSGVGAAKYTGLPFTSNGFPAVFPSHLVGGGSSASGIYAIVDASATTCSVSLPGATANVAATDTTCTNTFDIRTSGAYQASA